MQVLASGVDDSKPATRGSNNCRMKLAEQGLLGASMFGDCVLEVGAENIKDHIESAVMT